MGYRENSVLKAYDCGRPVGDLGGSEDSGILVVTPAITPYCIVIERRRPEGKPLRAVLRSYAAVRN